MDGTTKPSTTIAVKMELTHQALSHLSVRLPAFQIAKVRPAEAMVAAEVVEAARRARFALTSVRASRCVRPTAMEKSVATMVAAEAVAPAMPDRAATRKVSAKTGACLLVRTKNAATMVAAEAAAPAAKKRPATSMANVN